MACKAQNIHDPACYRPLVQETEPSSSRAKGRNPPRAWRMRLLSMWEGSRGPRGARQGSLPPTRSGQQALPSSSQLVRGGASSVLTFLNVKPHLPFHSAPGQIHTASGKAASKLKLYRHKTSSLQICRGPGQRWGSRKREREH